MKEFVVELTNRCRNSCIHCSSVCRQECDDLDLPLEDARKLALILRERGFKRIVFSGGEPILHPEFCEFIEYFHGQGFEIKLYTSGNYPRNVYGDDKYRRAFKLVHSMVLSCYSCDSDIHDIIVGNSQGHASFLKALNLFQRLDIPIELNLVPMRQNNGTLLDTYSAYVGKFARFNVLKLVRQGRARDNWDTISTSVRNLKSDLEWLANQPDTKVGTSFGEVSNSGTRCEAGSQKVCLTYDGHMLPCEVFKNERSSFPYVRGLSIAELTTVVNRFAELEQVKGEHGCHAAPIQNELILHGVCCG